MEQIFKTNCNVQPLHGRSIVRGTIYLKAQQLQSKNVSDKTYFKSDRLDIYYEYAEKLINKKAAYVCTCSAEKFKEFADMQKDCPCRKNDMKKNLELWNKMTDKYGFREGQAVLRFKSSMKDKNPAMRDFPLARINLASHPRQNKKYRVWPLMNFSVSVDDIEDKMIEKFILK